MKYDPVKRSIGEVVGSRPWLRKIFYLLLDILLLRTWHVKKAVRKLSRTMRPDASILDAGSGFGQYTWRIWRMNRGWKITGVDVKQEQIDDCNLFFSRTPAAANARFEYADLTLWNRANSFDGIISVDVMEHIEDDRAVFRNFHLSLREGGWLVISTPSDKGGSGVQHEHDDSFIDEHVRDGYGIGEITEKLATAGFSEISAGYTYGNPGKISWILSMKIPVTLLNISRLTAIVLPFWYLLVMPLCLVLNWLDTAITHREGTGLLVIAKKVSAA
ncbi:MAG: class I SAM-dependent methyltransferase [Bacteroidales bacterium]